MRRIYLGVELVEAAAVIGYYNNTHLAAQTYSILFQIYKYIPNIQIYTKYTIIYT